MVGSPCADFLLLKVIKCLNHASARHLGLLSDESY